MESLFQELVQQGLLKRADDVKLDNYLGTMIISSSSSSSHSILHLHFILAVNLFVVFFF